MIDAVIRWSLHNRLLVIVGALGLIIWGVRLTIEMPVEIFPDLSAPTVTVVTEAHGMAPGEVEQLITFPLESVLNGATGVRRVRSSSSVGISLVWVEFDWETDIYIARQIVSEKLQMVRASLPPDIESPILAPISSIMGEILFIGLTSEEQSPRQLRTIADWEVRRRLLAVPGVSQVVPIGGGVQQFQVLVRPDDLMARGVTLQEVVRAVRASNENASAGFYEQAGMEYLIYGLGRIGTAEDIAQAVVRAADPQPILVMDVADIQVGESIKRGDGAVNGRPGVVLGIQKQPGVNTLSLTRQIDTVLDELERSLPNDVHMERQLLRQADFIETGVENVTLAIRDGSILVIIIIGLFLLSGRATLITALAIPLSLVVAILVIHAMGGTLNTMTLGGMAIAVGALVDDAIIDVENVVRRLRERLGSTPKIPILTIVFEASKEIRGSIVFATLIIVLVFLPLFYLHGVESRLLEPLGIAYVVSLGASLVVALTITPVLCSLLLPRSRVVRSGEEPRMVKGLRVRYEELLRPILKHWSLLTGGSLLAVLIAAFAAGRAGRTFLPEFNEGALTISAITLPGTSLEQSNQIGNSVERLLLQHPEIQTTSRRTGRAELDEHAQVIHASEVDAPLVMGARDKTELLTALREDLATVPGTNVMIGQPITHRIDHHISGTRANIAVKIFGVHLVELQQVAEQVRTQMAAVTGVVDLAIEEQTNLPFATVRFDRGALARYGLSVRAVAETIETAFYGKEVSRVIQGPYAFDLVVRYPDEVRADLDAIRQTMIVTPSGAWVPLESLADIRRDRGPSQISRENGQRKIVVMCNVGEGRDLGSVVREIQERVERNVPLPTGYYVVYGGQFEAAQQAVQRLTLLGVVVLIGIFFLLYVALSSGRDALLVMVNLPLALIGGVVGVYVSGGVISIASLIGFITLFGIATRNGIMMVTHINHLMNQGLETDLIKVVVRGASERLAPILMTALASGLGLLPLALAAGESGSEIQAPMAVVILFGLITSTLLNMFVVPSMVWRFGSLRTKATV